MWFSAFEKLAFMCASAALLIVRIGIFYTKYLQLIIIIIYVDLYST